jgi:hypothetical protein
MSNILIIGDKTIIINDLTTGGKVGTINTLITGSTEDTINKEILGNKVVIINHQTKIGVMLGIQEGMVNVFHKTTPEVDLKATEWQGFKMDVD